MLKLATNDLASRLAGFVGMELKINLFQAGYK